MKPFVMNAAYAKRDVPMMLSNWTLNQFLIWENAMVAGPVTIIVPDWLFIQKNSEVGRIIPGHMKIWLEN